VRCFIVYRTHQGETDADILLIERAPSLTVTFQFAQHLYLTRPPGIIGQDGRTIKEKVSRLCSIC
jgi:hypothetical protein